MDMEKPVIGSMRRKQNTLMQNNNTKTPHGLFGDRPSFVFHSEASASLSTL
jgi:hypothetical protein